jgi:Txe/YoeB family toxin of Txe-Axe toxin-antitoxin module
MVFVAAFFFTGAAWGQETNRYTKVANQLVELINAGDYAGIQTNFNRQMAAALPLDKSSAFFAGLTRQFGKIEKLGEPQSVGGTMVYPAKFEKGTLDMQLVLEGRRELIAGLMFKPRVAAKAQAQSQQTDRYMKMANRLVELINAGDYAGMQTKFNKEMDAALPLDKSSEFFKGLAQQMGKIQKFGKPQFVGEGMVLPTEFQKGTFDMQLALDARGQIAGLAFTPHVER